jgi:hypothetical protein
MPKISETRDFNGFVAKVDRLGLAGLVAEVVSTLDFPLLVEEKKHANGTQGLRKLIDSRFGAIGGWTKISSGGMDWKKDNNHSATIGVEVQVSGRSDLLAVDIMHLTQGIESGKIDVGLIMVPDDTLSRFLTDRTPNYATAIKHAEQWAMYQPLRVIGFRHDGAGTPLDKMRTNLGRKKSR